MNTTGALLKRLADRADAPAIVRLILENYGPSYADPDFLDPVMLGERIAAGDVVFAIATDERLDVVAQMAAERRPRGLYEFGRALVSTEHRQRRLLSELGELIVPHLVRSGARFLSGRSVTHHLATQRYARSLGFQPLGLLIGLYPGETLPRERHDEVPAPSSATVSGRATRALRPRRLALAGASLDLALELLPRAGIEVQARRAATGPALGVGVTQRAQFGLTQLHVGAGQPMPLEDLPGVVLEAELTGARLIWADVPAEHRDASELVERLEATGFCFGAYLPLGGTAGEDVVRMQRYLGPPIDGSSLLVVEEAERLRHVILEQLAAVAECAR